MNIMPPAQDAGSLYTDLDDAGLIARVRAGDDAAFGVLYARHYRAAYAVAWARAGAHRADDLVSDAFLSVFKILRRGDGPDSAFRSYLVTTVRMAHLGSVRSARRELLVDDHESLGNDWVADGVDELLDSAAISRAIRTLPSRWQTVLWMTIVEDRTHDEVGEALGLNPNAVSALAFRAREGLRRAYLADHLVTPDDEECRESTNDFPAYLRGSLGQSRRAHVERHLEACASCEPVIRSLGEINRTLSAVS